MLATIDATPSTAIVASRWFGSAPAVFTTRWFGFIAVEDAGRYTFTVSSDDGAVLEIDGVPTVDNGGRHGLQSKSGTVALARGAHSVALTFRQLGGGFAIDWSWAREGEAPQAVPAWALSPQKVGPFAVRAWHLADIGATWLMATAVLLLAALAWLRRSMFAAHPKTAALVLFILLAVVHTWPMASNLAHLTRHDNRDSVLNEWIVAWVAHQLPRAPLHLFDGNIFHPDRFTLAYSEPMIVQALMAMPLLWLGASIVLACNVVLIAGMALSGWAMALVVRRWTGDWTAGLVAGSIFAFNAHMLSRIPHLQTQHVEFLPVALLAFDRLLDAPTGRNAVRLAGWFVLQSLTSVYLLVIAAFALVAAALARVPDVRRRPGPALRALLLAAGVSVVVLTPFLLPYWWVSRDLGLVRSLDDAGAYSATWSAYLATPARLHTWWSGRFSEGNVLFPGALGLLLATVALIRGVAFTDPRARMCLAAGVAGVALSFGAHLPGYAALYAAVPLLHGIRATARFGWLAICAVSVLAGFGVSALRPHVNATAWKPLAFILVAVASLESLAAPLGLTRFDGIPPIYAAVPDTPGTVVIEMPFFDSRSAQFHAHYMLNSTENWQPLVNGYSGFQPPSFYRNVAALQGFPDDASFARMRQLGVTHLFVHTDQLPDGTIASLGARADVQPVTSFGAIDLYRLK